MAVFVVLSSAWSPSVPALQLSRTLSDYTQGRFAFYGSLGLMTEKYTYSSETTKEDRMRLQKRVDLNSRGFIWDPRFATFDGGVTLQSEDISASAGDTTLNTLGYRLNTTWLANRPHPLSLSASRTRNTVADFLTPSYDLTSTNLGVRWGLENKWLGQTRFFYDRSRSESDSIRVPRSDLTQSYGLESQQKVRPRQWGESNLTLGYRRNEWDDYVFGNTQRQNYFYAYDRTLFGDRANLTANLTYYNRDDQWAAPGSAVNQVASNFLGFNSALTVEQTDKFRHFYNLGMSLNDVADTQSQSYSLLAGANYRFNERWQANGSLGWNSSSVSKPATDVNSLSQDYSKALANAGVQYSNLWGNLWVNGGYGVVTEWPQGDNNLNTTNTVTHVITAGYARRGSPLFLDFMDLRISTKSGQPSGNEQNFRYGVNSQLSFQDALQGVVEYRHNYQRSPVVGVVDQPDLTVFIQESKSARLDLGWLHRFSTASSTSLSAGATKSESQGVSLDSSYLQGRLNAQLRFNLQLTALARVEQIRGTTTLTGRKSTLESDLLYRFGKWQVSARYRLRDAQLQTAPFKEQSLIFYVRRDFGVSF
jgi:hypothetical protein